MGRRLRRHFLRQKSSSSASSTVHSIITRDDPPPGHTYLTIGQDLFSIEEYISGQYNFSLHQHLSSGYISRRHHGQEQHEHVPGIQNFIPAAAMFYTDIQTLRGLEMPTDYGSGIEYADGLLRLSENAPSAVVGSATSSSIIDGLQVGLWLNGTKGCQDILEGNLDKNILRLYNYLLKRTKAKKIFLRVGYEFDNPDFKYLDGNPEIYIQAFQRMANMYRRKNYWFYRDKIEFVWHSWAASSDQAALGAFYPGDDYVDWVGISLFSQVYPDSILGNMSTVKAVLNFANVHNKPIMIAESTPYGGIDKLDDPWNDWFQPVLNLINEHDIAMWSYINCNWDAQPMWKYAGFGDTRLSTNQTIMQLWQQGQVLNNPRFLKRIGGTVNKINSNNKQQSVILSNFLGGLSFSTTASGQLLLSSPWFWIPVAAIILVSVLVLRYFCCGRRYQAEDEGYIPVEEDDEHGGIGIHKGKLTGYGAIHDKDFSEGL